MGKITTRTAWLGLLAVLTAIGVIWAQEPKAKATPKYAAGDVINGKVVSVTDGDTIKVLVVTEEKREQVTIRLEGIDAPETGQSFGTKAKQALATKIFNKDVRVEVTGEDKYHRTLGWVYLDPDNINEWMVSHGWAWHFKKYNDSEKLAAIEVEAKEAKAGLWAEENALAPWEYRDRQQANAKTSPGKTATAPAPKSKIEAKPEPAPPKMEAQAQRFWLNTKSGVRHNPRCEHYGNTKSGRPCGPNEGRACGKCGG